MTTSTAPPSGPAPVADAEQAISLSRGCTAAVRPPRSVLDRQIHDARMRTFHGRARELSALDTALTDRATTFTVAHLHGPGGIGKSTLLLRLAELARHAGRPVVVIRPGQDDVEAYRPAGTAPPPVVLIDDLDRADQPVQWVRHTVLPAFPAGSLFAVASRRAPSVAWPAELGWSDLLLPLPLAPFTDAESARMLRALDVPGARVADVSQACGGNPLALRVAAQIITAGPDGDDEDLRRELALSISSRLIDSYPSTTHRHALEVCARAATTNVNLLHALLPGADADALFGWLCDLPFVTAGPRGLHPTDVVRTVVESESRWRDPDRFAALTERMVQHLRTRARAATGDAVLPAVNDVLFAQRGAQPSPSGYADLGGLGLREQPYRTADRAEVLALAHRRQGAGSARLVAFWLDRQPEGFQVIRPRGGTRIVAFVGQLQLSRPDPVETRTDPVVAAAWNRIQRTAALRPGGLLTIARFLVHPGSPGTTTLIRSRVATPLVRDDRTDWSVVVSPAAEPWLVRTIRTHTEDDTPPVVIDGQPYTVFAAHCAVSGADTRPAGVGWDRADFDREVRQALQCWRRPDLFADSALLNSRMIDQAGPDDAMTSLRQVITAALGVLGRNARQAKYHRVLVATYLLGAPTQEAAAERLDLPFSTYRRHLGRGLDDLCALLWKVEETGLRLLDDASS